jgi:L-iditol 2-dehydrogenase
VKMIAALLYAPMDMRVEEIPVPEPAPGEVVVHVGAATTCGTDLKMYRRGHPVLMKQTPFIFGHEAAGTIAMVGAGVSRWREGDRVVVANSAPCNQCYYCRRGRQSLCDDLLMLQGAYAEYLLVPERIVQQNLWPLPDHLSFAEAALTEPLACALHGVDASHIAAGDTVVINGSGPLGLLLLALARLRGAQVILCGRGAERLAAAARLGADHIINIAETGTGNSQVAAVLELTEGRRGADVVIEAVGTPETWELSAQMVRRGGLVNLFGGCPVGTHFRLDTQSLHYGEVTLLGIFHHTPYYFSTALDLIAGRRVNVALLLTGALPLSRADEAFQRLMQKEGIKYVLYPPGSEIHLPASG